MRALWEDIRFAVRSLGRQKLLTAVATITLALGMGVNTAIFSTVSGVLWNSLPYPQSERLLAVWSENRRLNFNQVNTSYRDTEDFRAAKSLENIAAYRFTQVGLRAAGAAQSIPAVETGKGFFEALQQSPFMGRLFREDELQPGDHRVVIITTGLWQREFAGDPNILSREVILDGRTHNIVGVMPPDFTFLYSKAEVFRPVRATVEQRNRRDFRSFRTLARLAPGKSAAEADAELKVIAQGLEDSDATGRGWSVNVRPLDLDVINRGARLSIQTMFWAVIGVLLIACANIASLLLARGMLRQRELAIRASLGAGKSRIARLLLTESLTLSLLGGVLAIAFAYWAIPFLRSLAPRDFPRLEYVQLNPIALGYTFLLCLLCGAIAGAAPAWMLTRGELARTLREGGRGGTFARQRLLQSLVAAEVALAMILLVITGLLVRSLSSSLLGNPGFDTRNLLTATVTLPESLYPDRNRQADFFRQLQEKLRQDARLESFSATQSLPLAGSSSWTPILIEGKPAPPPGERNLAGLLIALPNYFDTMKIPILAGRDFSVNDNLDAPRVAIINQTMAQRYWPEEVEFLGRQLRIAGSRDNRPLTIVGLVRDVRHNSPTLPPRPELYLPAAQAASTRLYLVARTRGNTNQATTALREAVWSIDRNQPLSEVETMDQVIDRRLAGPRVTVQILGFLAVLALLLAGLGIYGVLSYLTSQRSREIGIRIAMGAQPTSIVRLILGRGLLLAAAGLIGGSVGAAALAPLIRSLLDGIQPHDFSSFGWSALALLVTALLACALPVLRALRCDPVRVLREE